MLQELRGKLEPDPRNPELILTVRGMGYASQRVEMQHLWQVEAQSVLLLNKTNIFN